MIVLDANVLIAFLDARDAAHPTAVDLLTGMSGESFVASVVTIAEVLVKPASDGDAPTLLADLTAVGVEVVGLIPADALALAALRAEHGIRMPDAVVLHTAVTRRATLATLDRRLARAARGAGVLVVPG